MSLQHIRKGVTYSPNDCHWRVLERGADGIARCRLLQQLLRDGQHDDYLVTKEVCNACCKSFPSTFESINPVVASLVFDRTRTLAQVAGNGDEARRWHSINHWAVGVTTAPRRRMHLHECLDSLARAGWPRPQLFIDGIATIPSQWSHLPVTCRDEQLGAWPNYYLALMEMLMREPLADAFLLVQDDALFYCQQNVRQYLEEVLWPGTTPGIVSLYCASPDAQSDAGWFAYPGRWKYGAVCLIFPREVARRLVIAPPVFSHRWSEGDRGKVGIPDVIAEWAQNTFTPLYFTSPSLVQHIGETSSIWLGAYELTPERRAGNFLGDAIVPQASDDNRVVTNSHAAAFPEAAFPSLAAHEAEYRTCLVRGRQRMAQASAVICGLCRDVAPHLPATIARVSRLASMFAECDVVIYENDSQDDTPRLLREWEASNNRVHVTLEHLEQPRLNGTSRDRTERMAYYRNRCRERVLSTFSDRDFVIVADMDLEGGWSYDGVANSFGHDVWDFIGSNGISFAAFDAPETYLHVDSFAYRAVGQLALSGAAHGLVFHRGEPPLPVWSCFGGLGVYRMGCFKAACYGADDCEHVTFHQSLRERGFDRLFLNPSQIVLYSPWSPPS